MQIKIRYDNHFQTVEVPEEECESMIRNDYEERLAVAEDPSTVQPRTMQEIFDESFNRQEYNNYQKEHRRRASLDAFEEESTLFIQPDFCEDLFDSSERIRALSAAFEILQPQQKEIVRRVFFNNERPSDIAKELGISKQAMNDRLNKIYAVLRKKMKNF
ncbi:MAG: sigma-70 family RNA polymerase sigma factor [Clostridia bacterium]|nr:sigma-70 family RNA polymerase sigma factor [Clostridia bacterium]